jgi:hypothetical protein
MIDPNSMHSKRPLAPSFLNRFDRYLLKHKPELWSARTHLVLYYGLLFMAVLAAIAFVVPDDPRRDSPSVYWVGFVSLLSFIALIGWLIYLLRFNVFKRYGLTSGANRLITFLLYFLSIGTFVLFCYIEPYVETIRANAAYTEQELVTDIDKTNLGICRLEYDSLKHGWLADTVLVVEKAPAVANRNMDYTTTTDTVVLVPRSPRMTIDEEALKIRLTTEDSVQQLNDSVYVFFNCPTYALLQPYRLGSEGGTKPLTSVDIYRQVIKAYAPPNNKQEILRELDAIRSKYRWRADYPFYYVDHSNVEERIRHRYGLMQTSTSIDNIFERKYRWESGNLPLYVRIFIYTTLMLSLLLFAFRHSTVKTFFLSILTGIILAILTSLVLAFSRRNGEAFFEWIIFYFILSFGLSLTTFTMRKRSVFAGIAINLFLWLLPFIPLCIVANYYADQKYDPDYRFEHEYALQQLYLFWAEIGGLLLLLVALGTLMHKLYRKWYAAPEN